MDFPALALTLRLAGLTTVCLLFISAPLALWIASGNGWLRRVVQSAVALPLVLPPTVLGFYVLVGLGPFTWFGRSMIRLFGHSLAFTFSGLLFGSMIYSLPFAVQPLVAGYRAIDPRVVEVARVLGASPWQAFRTVLLPLTRMSFVTAAVLTFAHTVGEFGIVLMVGGDIPGVTRTLSISIYDSVQELNYAAATRMAACLVTLSFIALLTIYWRDQQRKGADIV